MPRYALCLLLALASCGGGADASPPSQAPPVASLYGDSLMVGAVAGPRPVLDTPPLERIRQIVSNRFAPELRAVSGAAVHQALAGDPPRWPWKPFSEQLLLDRPKAVVLRFGGADAIYGTDPEAFRADLTAMARQARAAGATPIIVGVIPCPPYAASSAALDRVNREVAAAENVAFVDLRALPFDPAVDIAPGDSVHPSQAYSDRIADLIAQSLRRLP